MSVSKIIEEVKTLSAVERRQALAELNNLLNEEPAEIQLQRALYEDGLLSEIKPPSAPRNAAEETPLIEIKGKPLSETIIEERR